MPIMNIAITMRSAIEMRRLLCSMVFRVPTLSNKRVLHMPR